VASQDVSGHEIEPFVPNVLETLGNVIGAASDVSSFFGDSHGGDIDVSEIDTAQLGRLKAAIEGSLKVGDSSGLAAEAMLEAQKRYRTAVVAILPDKLRAEFDGLFPPSRVSQMTDGRGLVSSDPFRAAAIEQTAREQLLALAGWLEGVIEYQDPRMG
jgi:hypothetical protein